MRKDIIGAKYDILQRDWSSIGIAVWKSLHGVWKQMRENLAFRIGKMQRLNFWWNAWCDEDALGIKFSNLYTIFAKNKATVTEMCNNLNLGFVRGYNDCQLVEVDNLFALLNKRRLRVIE